MTHSPIFGVLRVLNDGQVYDLSAIATAVGSSAEIILDAIQVLKNDYRVPICLPAKDRYQLSTPIQWLDEATVYQHLTAQARQTFVLNFFDEIDSTNARLMAISKHQAQHGLVLGAEWQSAGHGRMQRKWHMALGGSLAFSILWHFDCNLSALSGVTLAVGVAVARALHEYDIAAQLKWPNDIMLVQHKLGGILVEMSASSAHTTSVVIGIGLNRANMNPWVSHATGMPNHQSLPERNQNIATLLNHLHDVLSLFSTDGFVPFQQEWQNFCVHQGVLVHLLCPDQKTIEGIACGVDEQGALLLQTATGIQRHHVGEITLRIASGNYGLTQAIHALNGLWLTTINGFTKAF